MKTHAPAPTLSRSALPTQTTPLSQTEPAPYGNSAFSEDMLGVDDGLDVLGGGLDDWLGVGLGQGPLLGGLSGGEVPGGGGQISPGHPMLRLGSRGEDVRTCQRRLNLKGAELVEDGSFGPRTDGAVRSFQQRSGLAADGVVGPLTWAALEDGLGAAPAHADGPGGTHSALGLVEDGPTTPVSSLVPISGTPTGTTGPAGRAPRTQAELARDEVERDLDDIDALGMVLAVDDAEFAPFVSAGYLDPQYARTLAVMRDLGGETQYAYAAAKDALASGVLLGIVQAPQRNALINRRLAANDPDRAEFMTAAPTPTGAVFHHNLGRTRGLILVGAQHAGTPRADIVDLAHEINHLTNLQRQAAVEKDTSGDTAAGTGSRSAADMADTRRTFVNEMVARHEEWWVAQTMRAHRQGTATADTPLPAPGDLLFAAVGFAENAAQLSPGAYDPAGMWADLWGRSDGSLELQVRGWLPLVAHEQISENPYRDAASKALFAQAAAAAMGQAEDGLGARIYAS